jgi:hypothetical protein
MQYGTHRFSKWQIFKAENEWLGWVMLFLIVSWGAWACAVFE